MGQKAATDLKKTILELLKDKTDINIVFAAAPSQNEFFDALCSDKAIQWERINAYHMDEYIALPENAPQRFGNFLKRSLFGKVPFKSVNYIDSAGNVQKEMERYASLLQKNKIDIVCMGIGENGHIAFNDPHVADFKDEAIIKIVELDNKCRQQQVNDGCFSSINKVPTHALTLTIPVLISSPSVFCIVPGRSKAEAVFNTLYKDISEKYPSTILRQKKNAKLYVDTDSAFLLPDSDK